MRPWQAVPAICHCGPMQASAPTGKTAFVEKFFLDMYRLILYIITNEH